MPNATTRRSLDDGDTRVVHRTITLPVRNIKTDRPRDGPLNFLAQVSHISWWRNVAAQLSEHTLIGSLFPVD